MKPSVPQFQKGSELFNMRPKAAPSNPDTPVKKIEFAKNMQAYQACVGPPVKAPPPGAKTVLQLQRPETKN